MESPTLTAERLREVLEYDQETGVFRWLIATSKRVRVGIIAGANHSNGYLVIKIDKRSHFAHRLAWLYVHGEWPDAEIDHIDGNRANNRFDNLREATSSENKRNARRRRDNTSGFKGVSWEGVRGRWHARITLHGRDHHLGYFDTLEGAHAAYCKAAERLHGEFARTE